jgi:hypothetical protein
MVVDNRGFRYYSISLIQIKKTIAKLATALQRATLIA